MILRRQLHLSKYKPRMGYWFEGEKSFFNDECSTKKAKAFTT